MTVMNRIDVDWQAIHKFRNNLLNITEDLQEQLKRTDAVIEDVATEWNDPQFRKFNNDFQEDKALIKPLCERIEDFEAEVLTPFENRIKGWTDDDF